MAKNIVVGRILTHSLVQNYLIVILMCIVQRIAMLLWCDVQYITMWHCGCYFADSPKSIQYFCHSMLPTLWQLNAHETRFIGFSIFAPLRWNIFYQFREIRLTIREIRFTFWQKYTLLAALLYFREELAAVPTFELQSVQQRRLWRTNDISNPSVLDFLSSSSFTLSLSVVCVITFSIISTAVRCQ